MDTPRTDAAPTPDLAERRPITTDELTRARRILDAMNTTWRSRMVGQDRLRFALVTALMCDGHILLESVPGLAKTTAATVLADSVSATFARIQCTPDLLPSDIIGTEIWDATSSEFSTQLGPVHAQFVLLDEINRSSAKTQSAMLEAMQERQTSIGGETYPLPTPFMVMATQNPIEEEGTYVLPQAQMDRFLLKETITYPTADEEVEILDRIDRGVLNPSGTTHSAAVASTDDVAFLQDLTARVYVDESIKRYAVNLIGATRHPARHIDPTMASYIDVGASPRGSIALHRIGQALALMSGRNHVQPQDLWHLSHSVLRHRIVLNFEAVADGVHVDTIIDAIYRAVPAP